MSFKWIIQIAVVPFATAAVYGSADNGQGYASTLTSSSVRGPPLVSVGQKLIGPPREEMVDVGDHKLQILRGGDGSPTVVMEAGLGGTLDTWRNVVPELNGITSTVCYSRAGSGASGIALGSRTPEAIANELHTMLNNSGIRPPFVLVGHSLGAIYVRVFAIKYPYEVAGIVLVDGSHERQFREAFGNDPIEVTRQIEASVPSGAPSPLKAEWAAMLPIYVSGKLNVEGQLPDVPFAALTSLRVPAASGMSAHLSEGTRAQVPNIKRRLNSEVFQKSSYGIEVVTARSGHFIQNDEPALVVDAIRWVVEASRRSK